MLCSILGCTVVMVSSNDVRVLINASTWSVRNDWINKYSVETLVNPQCKCFSLNLQHSPFDMFIFNLMVRMNQVSIYHLKRATLLTSCISKRSHDFGVVIPLGKQLCCSEILIRTTQIAFPWFVFPKWL